MFLTNNIYSINPSFFICISSNANIRLYYHKKKNLYINLKELTLTKYKIQTYKVRIKIQNSCVATYYYKISKVLTKIH